MQNTAKPVLVLASRSPRRRQLLDQIGLGYSVQAVDVAEVPEPGERPLAYVTRVARAKAEAGLQAAGRAGLPVLAADTAVVVDGCILGKPAGRAQAMAMLGRLSGRSHRVYTAVALLHGEIETAVSVSKVTLRRIDAGERAAYWATGEPADKAGGYAIQGRGAVFVERVVGSYSGVMGLPLFETGAMLAAIGVQLP